MTKIALGIEYNGQGFHGWQTQQHLPTIQGCLETALSQIASQPIKIFCAGRTDAGVHATGQVIHFETDVVRDARAWIVGTNSYLPPSISVAWMKMVDDDFHARFSAKARRYHYIILNHSVRSALLDARAAWFYHPLNVECMQHAANHLIGEHDFNSYRSAQCEAKTSTRHIQELIITRHGEYVSIEIQANAFLHHMVRNIAGVLMQIGIGAKDSDWSLEVLHAKDRRAAAATAFAGGLYLTQVIYPEHYDFPKGRNLVWLMV